MQPIRIEFELNSDDHRQFLRLSVEHGRLKVMWRILLVLAVLTFLAFGFLFAIKGPSLFRTLDPPLVAAFLIFLAMFTGVAGGRKQFAQAMKGKLFHLVFDDDGLHWSDPDGQGSYKMRAFRRWLENDALIGLEHSQGFTTLIPKRALTEDSEARLRVFLVEHLGKPR